MAGKLSEIISQLEQRRSAIERALSALRDVDGIESQASNAATSTAEAAIVARKGRKSQGATPPNGASLKKRSAVKKAGETPVVKAPVPSIINGTRKLTEGTMKARTVELLRSTGRPMKSGEVAKRMKISADYASVNLSQLRRDGFLTHTADGYAVI